MFHLAARKTIVSLTLIVFLDKFAHVPDLNSLNREPLFWGGSGAPHLPPLCFLRASFIFFSRS